MESKKSKNVLLAIMGVLVAVELVIRIIVIQTFTLPGIAQLISLVFAVLYGFWLYKKPHGNMLKYAMLIFAFCNIIIGSYYLILGAKIEIAKIVATAAVCYCAGRLDRIDQNKYIMPIIGIVFLIVSIIAARSEYLYVSKNIFCLASCFTFTINYITLMIAYFTRFKEHKEAGLMDAPKE